jgi:hypothetical protein
MAKRIKKVKIKPIKNKTVSNYKKSLRRP